MAAIQTPESDYRDIMAAANDAIFLLDADTGAIIDVNRKMCEMYGCGREEAIRLEVEDFSSGRIPYTQSFALGYIRKAAMGESQLFQWIARARDGRLFRVEVNIRQILLDGAVRALASVRDISSRKPGQGAQQGRQDHFQRIFQRHKDEARNPETSVNPAKREASDCLVKPVENMGFIPDVTGALEIYPLESRMAVLEHRLLSSRLNYPEAFASIVGASGKMLAVFQYCDMIAASRRPVLVTGETGTGKELISRAIHHLSGAQGRFVPVNVAGLDDMVFTDTLFGHRKGAFTGAGEARRGLIDSAAGGALFLDEIGDLTESAQIKLLRLLQEGEYYPLGADTPRKSAARIIVSTNRDLREAVASRRFRADLYYRLCAHNVVLPPLRERREDIPLLVEHFLRKAAQSFGKKRPSPPSQLFSLLSVYAFPGNVRELEAMVFDAVARHTSGVLSLSGFREAIGRGEGKPPASGPPAMRGASSLLQLSARFPTLKEAEAFLVSEALRLSKGNQGAAASLLGISRTALNKRLKKMA